MTRLQSVKYYHWEKAFNSGGLFNPADRQNEIPWMEDEGGQLQPRNKVHFCLKQRKQLAIKEPMERCTRSPSSLSLKQNLIMFEMIDVTGSEVRGPATVSHRNHYSWFIKDPLKNL